MTINGGAIIQWLQQGAHNLMGVVNVISLCP